MKPDRRHYCLQTERIGFSIWGPEDLALAKSLWGDPAVTRFLCAGGIFRDEDIAQRLGEEICREQEHQVQYWPIFELSTEELIGCCGLRPGAAREYELGFHLRPNFWGQGYGREAAGAVVRHAFTALGAQRLSAGHHPGNKASQKLLCSLGFTSIGDRLYPPTGLRHPTYELHPPAESGGRAGKAVRIAEVGRRTPALLVQLLELWEGAVRATHLFLSDEEIDAIRQIVPQALASVPRLIVAESEEGRALGFMGLDGQKLEMLFVSRRERGKGVGKKLLRYGMEHHSLSELTVNEQNPSAKAFYEHMGFHVYQRTEKDEQGNPYPLLYLKLD